MQSRTALWSTQSSAELDMKQLLAAACKRGNITVNNIDSDSLWNVVWQTLLTCENKDTALDAVVDLWKISSLSFQENPIYTQENIERIINAGQNTETVLKDIVLSASTAAPLRILPYSSQH